MIRKQYAGSSKRAVAGVVLIMCVVIHNLHVSPHQEVETEHSFDVQYVCIKKKKERYKY